MKKNVDLKSLIPFLDEEDLEKVADKIMEKEDRVFKGVTLPQLVPFLDEDTLEKIFHHELKAGKEVSYLLPFLDSDCIDLYIINEAKKGNFDKCYGLIPLADEDVIETLVGLYLKDEIELDIDRLYPFMDEDDIKRVFKKAYLDDDSE